MKTGDELIAEMGLNVAECGSEISKLNVTDSRPSKFRTEYEGHNDNPRKHTISSGKTNLYAMP
jgi:hypothetical protein